MRQLPKILIVLLLLSVSIKAQSQSVPMADSLKTFLDTVINITHREALNRDSVNWDTLRKAVYLKAATAKKTTDLIPAIWYIFDQLHDNHGGVMYKGHLLGQHKPRQPYSAALLAQIKSFSAPPKLKVKILDGYGYILIPSFDIATTGGNNNTFAQEIKDSINTICSKKIKGWIIDLRLDPGGSMYPMIGGIGSLIGDGKAGVFVDNKYKALHTWSIKGGDVYYDSVRSANTINKCDSRIRNMKIAVLIGPITQSAGEATAISLKGRPNTKFFGENTGGFTTGNISHQLNSNMSLLVASYIEADRNNTVYPKFVAPDVCVTDGDNFSDLGKDMKVTAALNWLKQ